MGVATHCIATQETQGHIVCTLKKPTSRYADAFIRHEKNAMHMLEAGLFPNFKEITESFAMWEAARSRFKYQFPLNDPDVTMISIGDGSTPRTAGLFAMQSAWKCHSVDPNLNMDRAHRYATIDRLFLHRAKAEDVSIVSSRLLLVACHSHADLARSVDAITGRQAPGLEVGLIAMPCCVPINMPNHADAQYTDWGCWSPKREIFIWRDLVNRENA